MSIISMKQLLEAGVHFGHQSKKWNPKMKKYIFTARNNIHIINLEETSLQIDKAYAFIRDMVAEGKNILFVGTKKQAQEIVKEEAERCGMFYINSRWLGGTLTNFKTIKSRIERLNKLIQMEKVGEMDFLPKKEVLGLKAEKLKLEKNLNGIKEMREFPGVIFLIDPLKEHICVREAINLKIPVVAIVDTNGDPSGIDYVIPANDDALRSVKLITSAIADAVIEAKEGISLNKESSDSDEDIDIKTALVEALSTMEIAKQSAEEEKDDSKLKKAKPVKKVEKTSESKANSEEVKSDKPAEDKKNVKSENDEPLKTEVKSEKVDKSEQKAKTEKTENAKVEKPVKAEEKSETKKDEKPVKTEKVEEKSETKKAEKETKKVSEKTNEDSNKTLNNKGEK